MPDTPPIKRLQKSSGIPRKRIRFDVIGKDDPRILHAWEKLRNSYRDEYPVCQRCKHLGQLDKLSVVGLSVHHIRGLFTARDKEELNTMCFDRGNLLTVCSRCHGYYSGLERANQTGQAIREGMKDKNFDNN